ncbi:MAG TPA: hypothetical protein V6C76_16880 [Drouetiella sp.]
MTDTTKYETIENYKFTNGPARVYLWNNQVAVIISEVLAARYDHIRSRNLQLVDGQHPPKFVPEIIFYYLEKLPIPAIITEVIVQGLAPAGETAGQLILGELAAESLPSGRMILPVTLQESQLERALLYGWARLMLFNCEVEAHYYKHTMQLEPEGFKVSQAATIAGPLDDWALHMVNCFIQSDDSTFTEFVEASPLRAVFIARALERIYEEHSESLTDNMSERIRIVGESIVPLAQQKLQSLLQQNAQNVELVQTVFRLMLVLNPSEHLTLLPLTEINLSYEPHNNVLLSKLGAMPQIESLDLSDSMLSREGTQFLQNLVNLKKLDVSNTRVMSSSLNPLRGMHNLEDLNLSGTQVNESIVSILPKIKSLKKLNVTDTDIKSTTVLKSVMPDCEILG